MDLGKPEEVVIVPVPTSPDYVPESLPESAPAEPAAPVPAPA